MTKKELTNKILDILNKEGDFYNKEMIAGFSFTEVDRVGGEDEGTHYHIVWKVVDVKGDSFFLMALGYYSSWDATSWSDVYEVVPYQKMVTDWAKV